jgi:cation diffusion facilitator family transporter
VVYRRTRADFPNCVPVHRPDAAHLLSDLGSFTVSLVMLHMASRRASRQHSFGYHRAEVLGALFSVMALWLVTGMLVAEAIHRLRHPETVAGATMFGVAIAGVVVNLALVAVFSGAGGHGHSHGGLSGGHGHSHGGGGGGHGGGRTRQRGAPGGSLLHLRPAEAAEDDEEAQLLQPAASEVPTPPPLGSQKSNSLVDYSAPGAVFFTLGTRPPADAVVTSTSESPQEAPPAPPPPPPPPVRHAAPCGHGHSHGGGHSHSHGHSHGASGDDDDGETGGEVGEDDGDEECGDASEDMNVRSAYLHVLGDLIQSIGVAIAGGIIWWRPSLRALDPILTFTFSAVALATTGKLMRDIVDIVMERCPRDVDAAQLASSLAQLPGVSSVHDLHIWALVPGKTVLTVHLEHGPETTARSLLAQAQRMVTRRFGIQHSTIQVEPATQ